MKAVWPWLAFLALGAWTATQPFPGWEPRHLWLAAAVLLCDVLYAIAGPDRFSRVAPALALTGLWLGPGGATACLFALFVGSLILMPGHEEDAGRSLLPLAAAAATLPGPDPSLPRQLLFLQVYLITALLVPSRGPVFRYDFLVLLAAPGLAAALATVLNDQPLLAPLFLPVLLALACAREDTVELLGRLRRAVERLEKETTRRRRLAGLLKAANRMASTLDPEELKKAFQASLDELVSYRSLEWTPEPVVDTDQRDMADVLLRIYATCRQNADALEQVRQAQARLLAANRLAAVGRLAAGVAHELNTPLAAIGLSAEHAQRMLEKHRPEAVGEKLDVILRSTDKARLTVQRLRSYARPDREDETVEAVALAPVVEDALALLEHRLGQVELEARLDPEATVTASAIELYGIVNNLLSNALDAVAGQPPPRRLRVTVTRHSLEVEDNGPGVPPALRHQIFEAFFTTKPIGKGMGLGLHLVAQTVDSLGGRVEVTDSPLGGALFRVTLP